LWQSFKNYFVTAQLIAGFAMAARLVGEGPWGMLIGFLAVAPLAALFAILKAAYDLRKTRQLQP
jgi:F0F1-type ATP synthase assembly protein I